MSGTASNGQTSYAYDAQGNLTSVTDPNGNITSYSYDSFDNLIQQNSPDTGITSYTYDDAGNRISQTDANGVTTRYSYDALNRLIEIDYPNAKLNVNFTYDENGGGQNGVGRLTSQEDASGTTKYTYDLRGNVLTQTSIRGSITLTMGYAYNSADQLVQATYPDGRRFDYQYDASGNISDITTDYQGTVQSVISNIQHQPFGPVMGMTYGNGLTLGQIYDLDTRLTQSTTPSILERGYGFDDGSNITSITNDLDPSATESFGYDNLNRLETAGGSYGSLGYSYDPTHNRTQKTDSIEGDTYYDYDLNNNHLTAVTAGDTKNYQYDAVGNIVDNNSYRFDYADNNRLAAVKVGNKKIATYKYNGQGQRTEKIIGKITTHYLYGLQGELLAEIETTRKSQGVLRNYLYLNGRPVAITEASSLYYIHSDHLGTPQVITDQNQANVWRASYSPFGQALITTEVIVNNIRFNKGKLDPKNNPSMILSSLLCIASGGSLGPEAPLVQVIGSTGTWLGKLFRLKGEELRSMSIAGMASGFTAMFGAPLGGSLFSLEILHHKHAVEYYKAIIPALVASSFSYVVFAFIIHLGLGTLWELSSYEYSGILDFGLAVIFAISATAVGWFFIYCTKLFKSLFEKQPLPIYIKTLIGGILLGIISYYLPITRYFSHYQINDLLAGDYTLYFLLLIIIMLENIVINNKYKGYEIIFCI